MTRWLWLVALCDCDRVLGLQEKIDAAVPDAPKFDPENCPKSYEVVGNQRSLYRVIAMEVSWEMHHALCRADDPDQTHLAVLDGAFEIDDVRVWVDKMPFPNDYFWIGARQPSMATAVDEGWIWISKAPVVASAWDNGEPNDDDGVEDGHEQAAAIRKAGALKLTDLNDTLMNRGVCECDGLREPPP
jgi:hypothetical protein